MSKSNTSRIEQNATASFNLDVGLSVYIFHVYAGSKDSINKINISITPIISADTHTNLSPPFISRKRIPDILHKFIGKADRVYCILNGYPNHY